MEEARQENPPVPSTRHKLLEAAARVFARSGLEGATTRGIAREAGVNEVTLFRHFQSKDNLLAAVLRQTFSGPGEALQEQGLPPPFSPVFVPGENRDLRAELSQHIQSYERLVRQHIALLRTLIGEIHRHEEHEVRVFKGIFAPLKVGLIATIHAARARGAVRAEVDPLIAADLLGSMIFMNVLRCSSHVCPEYPNERYLDTALDVFVRGIEPFTSAPETASQP